MEIVWMFSGQGAQKPGMGADLCEHPLAREVYECASDHFGFDVARFSQEASQDEINETKRAQGCMVALSLALDRILKEQGLKPSAVLGFSLGQVSALASSGMLSLDETMRFAAFRADAMSKAAHQMQGAMTALLGADEEQALTLCKECAEGEVLVVANYNCPGQVVISGAQTAIERAEHAWGGLKKRCARLATSGAFHSPLMNGAAAELANYLKDVTFSAAQIPLICNMSARELGLEQAQEHLSQHVVSPVHFEQSVRYAIQQGAHCFVEVGFGGVLAGLVRRIDKGCERCIVASLEDVKALEGK